MPIISKDAGLVTPKGALKLIIDEHFIPFQHAKADPSDPFVREAIFSVFKGRCFYSGRELSRADASIDHVIPSSRGGPDNIYNYVLAAKRLNSVKGAAFDFEAARGALAMVATTFGPRVERKLGELKYQANPQHVAKLLDCVPENCEFSLSPVVAGANRKSSAAFETQVSIEGTLLGDPIVLAHAMKQGNMIGGYMREVSHEVKLTQEKLATHNEDVAQYVLNLALSKFIEQQLKERDLTAKAIPARQVGAETLLSWDRGPMHDPSNYLRIRTSRCYLTGIITPSGHFINAESLRPELKPVVLSCDKYVR